MTRVGRLSELWHDAGDPHSVVWSWFVNAVVGSALVPSRIRTMVLRWCGFRLHPLAIVRPGVLFRTHRVGIGRGSVLGARCVLDVRHGLEIGDYVSIASGTQFITSDHDMSDPRRRGGPTFGAPIRVGDGASIGAGSVILPGVTIGEGAVVGAGSVIAQDCEPHMLYLGSPARRVRELPVRAVDSVSAHGNGET